MKKAQMIEFNELGDTRGKLTVIEGGSSIPFDIKRMFYIYGTSGNVVRGQHANKRSEFVLINLQGSCKVKTIYKNGDEEIFDLDRPNIGLWIPRLVWKDMYDFSDNSILIALSNEHYDGTEYIRDIKEFKGDNNG